MKIKPSIRYLLHCEDWLAVANAPYRVHIIGLISSRFLQAGLYSVQFWYDDEKQQRMPVTFEVNHGVRTRTK